MLATKNRVVCTFVVVALAVLLAGCTPPGPQAVLDGKRLLDKGDFAAAVTKLQTAVSLLSTNASAWNYLGLAYHHTGQTTNAVAAYQKALSLDRNLVEARFNLGCLWLDAGQPEAAKAEFTAYTLRRPNAPEGWMKLGLAQLSTREITAAEKSFSQSVRLKEQNPDAYNGIGLAQLQRNRPREAAQYFESALKQQPDHRAALLNLARVAQTQLNDPQTALRRYRDYLALDPRPADWAEVRSIADALQQQITAQQQRPAPAPTNTTTKVVTAAPPAVVVQTTSAPPVVARPPVTARTETPKPTPTPVVAQPSPQRTPPSEIVSLPPEPVIKTTPDAAVEPVKPAASEQSPPAAAVTEQPVVASAPPAQEKRGFFQRLNPVNLFRKDPKPTQTTPLPPETLQTSPGQLTPIPPQPAETSVARTNVPAKLEAAVVAAEAPAKPVFPRFTYAPSTPPVAGNRAAANVPYAQGVKLRDAGQTAEAADAFRNAVKEDASFFEAQFNLALAEYQLQRHRRSLAAWQVTLAIRPDSADARYNFALALTAAGYPVDAANELERLIAGNPDDARAHLAAGNLFAGPLQDKARARKHYQRVLEIAPGHSQSSAIRYWLVTNPQ